MAGIGQEVGAHALHAAAIGFVTHHQQGQALIAFDRQRAAEGAPVLVARTARGIKRYRTTHPAKQALIDTLQDFGRADRADQKAAFA